jgi:hypothetical protein
MKNFPELQYDKVQQDLNGEFDALESVKRGNDTTLNLTVTKKQAHLPS